MIDEVCVYNMHVWWNGSCISLTCGPMSTDIKSWFDKKGLDLCLHIYDQPVTERNLAANKDSRWTKKIQQTRLKNKTCPGSAFTQMLDIFSPGRVRFTQQNSLGKLPLFRWLWPRIVCFYEIKSPPTHHPCIQVKSPGLFPRSTHSAQASVCWFFQDHQ